MNETITNLLFEVEVMGNLIIYWIAAVIGFIIILVLLKMAKNMIVKRMEKLRETTGKEIFGAVKEAANVVHSPLYVILSLYFASNIIDLKAIIGQVLYYVFLIVVVYYAVKVLLVFVDYALEKNNNGKPEDNKIGILSIFIKVIIWAVAAILLLSNFGYDVTSLLAGLGIGGLAVAMASQQILGDIIGAFTIHFDKPFKIGDKIAIGDMEGKVIIVGIRSTRMKTANGEEIIIPNKDLANSRIKKFPAN